MKSCFHSFPGRLLLLCIVLLLFPLWLRSPQRRGDTAAEGLSTGDSVRCVLTLRDDPGRGLAAGFQYARFRKYSDETGCEALIRLGDPAADWGDSLRGGTVDVVIARAGTLDAEGLMATRSFGDSTVWFLRDEALPRVRHMNGWIADLLSTPQYARERKAFFKRQGDLSAISPYDRIVKRHAAATGWDWRLISAVIYHESRFSPNAESHKGAVGLMQVVPRRHSADSLLDPETNIRVGTRYLAKLEKMFSPGSASPAESIQFALAAFNAGEGTVQRYIDYAAAQDADCSRWRSVAAAVRGMEGFKGGRTLAYVDSVLTTYYGYTRFYEE